MVICLSVHCWVGYIWFGWHGAVVPNKCILISIHLKYSNYKFIFVRTLWLLPLDTITIATSILALLLLLPSISTSSAIMHCINISISDIHYPNINFQNTEWTIDGILGYGGVTERSGTGRTNDWKRDDQRMLWNCNWESISLPSAGIISSEWLLVVMKFEIYRTHPIMNWVSGNTHWWLVCSYTRYDFAYRYLEERYLWFDCFRNGKFYRNWYSPRSGIQTNSKTEYISITGYVYECKATSSTSGTEFGFGHNILKISFKI